MLISSTRRLVTEAKQLARRLARDEAGVTITAELVMVVTAAVLALAVGLEVLADATAEELADLANAIHVDQSYSYNGLSAPGQATCSGSSFSDSDPFVEVTPVSPTNGQSPVVIQPPVQIPAPTPGNPVEDPGDALLPLAVDSLVPANVEEIRSLNTPPQAAAADPAKLQQLRQMERDLAAFQARVLELRQQCETNRR